MSVLDLFAGPGGWDLAARALGIDPLGIELDRATCATRRAAGLRTLCGDVASLSPARFAPVSGLIASAPCPTFSAAGRGSGRTEISAIIAHIAGGGDRPVPEMDPDALDLGIADADSTKTWLVVEPLRYARALRPEWIALEQVPAVLPIWEAIAAELDRLGYSTATGILSAECYGVPQVRARAILVASRLRAVTLPSPTHSAYHSRKPLLRDPGVPSFLTMADALGWGLSTRPYPTIACSSNTGGPDKEKVGGSGARRQLYAEIAAGRWVGPLDSDGSVRLSLARAAELQGFPADYPWQGTATQQFSQIGNAIPVPLARAILSHIAC